MISSPGDLFALSAPGMGCIGMLEHAHVVGHIKFSRDSMQAFSFSRGLSVSISIFLRMCFYVPPQVFLGVDLALDLPVKPFGVKLRSMGYRSN